MQSVGRAIEAFEEQGFVWRRPDDFFAEMLKSDEHMQKVSSPSLLVASHTCALYRVGPC